MLFFDFEVYGFLSALIVSLAIQCFFFFFAYTFKTDKVTDLSYSLSFLILTVFVFAFSEYKGLSSVVVTILVILWSIRLGTYLFFRIMKMKVDHRFDKMRNNFFKFGIFWLIQAFTVWIVLLPVIYLINSPDCSPLYVVIPGIVLWLSGFILETTADIQKFRFKNTSEGSSRWIESGVWKYSRHPNYFGEMVMWWSVFVLASPSISDFGWFTALGPLFITFMLLFVSGVTMLEKSADKKYGNIDEYRAYRESTSVLIPWFKKRI